MKRVLLVLLLLLVGIDVAYSGGGRRSIRIDGFGSWDEFAIGSSSCAGTTVGSTLVQWQGWTFSGREAAAHLTDTYCQIPTPGTFNQTEYFYADETALAGFLGENADDAITGLRYAFLDQPRFDFTATGFQWMFVFFPSGLTVVGLYGFEAEPLDHRSYIAFGPTRVWDGGLDGYDGEYFCFQDADYIGTWNGTLDDGSACLAALQRLFGDGFEPAP